MGALEVEPPSTEVVLHPLLDLLHIIRLRSLNLHAFVVQEVQNVLIHRSATSLISFVLSVSRSYTFKSMVSRLLITNRFTGRS